MCTKQQQGLSLPHYLELHENQGMVMVSGHGSGFSYVPYLLKSISFFEFPVLASENRMLNHTLGVYMIWRSSLRYKETHLH